MPPVGSWLIPGAPPPSSTPTWTVWHGGWRRVTQICATAGTSCPAKHPYQGRVAVTSIVHAPLLEASLESDWGGPTCQLPPQGYEGGGGNNVRNEALKCTVGGSHSPVSHSPLELTSGPVILTVPIGVMQSATGSRATTLVIDPSPFWPCLRHLSGYFSPWSCST